MAAASISKRSRRPLRIVFLLTLAMIGLPAMGPAHAANDVYVLQDGTPLVSKPGVGGKILRRVDTGFPLTVVGREGDWLKVSSSRLKAGSGTLWVPAVRVGRRPPDTRNAAYSQEGPSGAPDGGALFLEVAGTQGTSVRGQCRIVQPDKDDIIDVNSETPLQLDVSGSAVDCIVRQFGVSEPIDVALRTAEGELVAAASTDASHAAVRVRTDGPWGGAFGFMLRTRFFAFIPNSPLTPGNPVPPLGNAMPALSNPVPPLGTLMQPFGNPGQPFRVSP